MSAPFDPYHKWLGIRPEDQPPTYYRLLGLAPFEGDAEVIAMAVDQRMGHIKTFQLGEHSDVAERLLNEVSTAKLCLLRPERKAAYDEKLRKQLAPPSGPPQIGPTANQPTPPPHPYGAAPQPMYRPMPRPSASMQPLPSAVPLPPAAHGGHPAQAPREESLPAPVIPLQQGAVVQRRRRKTDWQPLAILAGVVIVGVSVIVVLAKQRQARIAEASRPSALAASAQPGGSLTAQARAALASREPNGSPFEANKPAAGSEPRQALPSRPAAGSPIAASMPTSSQPALSGTQPATPSNGITVSAGGPAVTLSVGSSPAVRSASPDFQRMLADSVRESEHASKLDQRRVASNSLNLFSSAFYHDSLVCIALLELGESSAALSEDRHSIERAAEQRVRYAEALEHLQAIQPALATLKANPNDADACAVVGKYHCFLCNRWSTGLSLLRKSSDPQLKAAANASTVFGAGPAVDRNAQDRELGDRWWALAEKETGSAQLRPEERAVACYKQMLLRGVADPQIVERIRIAAEHEAAYKKDIDARIAALTDERLALAGLAPAARPAVGAIQNPEREPLPDNPLDAGLQLLAAGKDKEAHDKLLEAAKLDPGSQEPDFIIATVYACVAKNPQMANRRYELCLKRDRKCPAVLNNLAVTEIQLGNPTTAVVHWKNALAASTAAEIAQNVAHMCALVDNKGLAISGSSFNELRERSRAIGGNSNQGWQFMVRQSSNPDGPPVLSKRVADRFDLVLRGRAGESYFRDESCFYCRGSGKLDCSVRACSRGTISTTQRIVIGQNPSTGDTLFQDRKVRVPCQQCNGTGTTRCLKCEGDGTFRGT